MALDDLQKQQLNKQLTQNLDLNRRRITNLGRSLKTDDAVTRAELDEVRDKLNKVLKFLAAKGEEI